MAGKRCLSIAAIRGARQVASPQARCPQVRARLLGANLGRTLFSRVRHFPLLRIGLGTTINMGGVGNDPSHFSKGEAVK